MGGAAVAVPVWMEAKIEGLETVEVIRSIIYERHDGAHGAEFDGAFPVEYGKSFTSNQRRHA